MYHILAVISSYYVRIHLSLFLYGVTRRDFCLRYYLTPFSRGMKLPKAETPHQTQINTVQTPMKFT